MATWKIIVNSFLILVILAASIAVIADYRKHKDDESISPWFLFVHVVRFFS